MLMFFFSCFHMILNFMERNSQYYLFFIRVFFFLKNLWDDLKKYYLIRTVLFSKRNNIMLNKNNKWCDIMENENNKGNNGEAVLRLGRFRRYKSLQRCKSLQTFKTAETIETTSTIQTAIFILFSERFCLSASRCFIHSGHAELSSASNTRNY